MKRLAVKIFMFTVIIALLAAAMMYIIQSLEKDRELAGSAAVPAAVPGSTPADSGQTFNPPTEKFQGLETGSSPVSLSKSGLSLRLEDIPAGELRSKLETLTAVAQVDALKTLQEAGFLPDDAASLRVDDQGGIYFVCTFKNEGSPVSDDVIVEEDPVVPEGMAAAAPVPISDPPIRHSRPGAPNILFVDCNGHVIENTRWNSNKGIASWDCRPYDTDGDETTFSNSEQNDIIQIWERMAEDFAPFDVDVTTEQPASWNSRTGHALITPTTDKTGQQCPHYGYGGVAYVGVFNGSSYSYNKSNCYSPAWVKNMGKANSAEAASHELGHNLGLSHDGTSTKTYYGGHVNGSISWGPIMGTGYGRNISQWCKGEYFDANRTNQNDLTVIKNKLTYRTDDYGNNNANADVLNVDGNGTIATDGVVEKTNDPDVFHFTTGAGQIGISVEPYRASSSTWGGNLDVLLELYNQSGTLIATNNPENLTSASITLTVPAGKYYIHVKPVGVGDPLNSTPSGYTSYGSLGQYSVGGEIYVDNGLPLPYAESFESGMGAWKQSAEDDFDWTRNSGGTPGNATGPSGASDGSWYLYTEATRNFPAKNAAVGARFDFSGIIAPQLSFDYHMYGGKMGTLAVDVYNGAWSSNVWSLSGKQHTSTNAPWSTAEVDLSAFGNSSGVTVSFRGLTADGAGSDISIDNINLAAAVDSDSDGIPDEWEERYFGGPTNALASIDTDGDGCDNLSEFISGSDPTNFASFFEVTSEVPVAEPPGFVVEWNSVSGRVYDIHWNADLGGSFELMQGDIPHPQNSYTDTVHGTEGSGFYRIDVRLQNP